MNAYFSLCCVDMFCSAASFFYFFFFFSSFFLLFSFFFCSFSLFFSSSSSFFFLFSVSFQINDLAERDRKRLEMEAKLSQENKVQGVLACSSNASADRIFSLNSSLSGSRPKLKRSSRCTRKPCLNPRRK